MYSSDSDSDLEFILNIPTRIERKFQDRKSFLADLSEKEFRRKFRMSKESFSVLLDKIKDEIGPKTAR